MEHDLRGIHVAVLAMDGFERVELTEPCEALREAGAVVHVVSPEGDWVRGWHGEDWWAAGVTVEVELVDAKVEMYDALVVPGGLHSAVEMRTNRSVVDFVRRFLEDGKPVATIGHGAWMLIEAEGVKGRRVTSHPALRTDLLNAGAQWVDTDVVVDNGLITSRLPDDVPSFVEVVKAKFAEVKSSRDHGQPR